jgi:hypothetical protein
MDLHKVKVYVISPGIGKYEKRLKTTLERLYKAGFEDIEHVPSVPDPSHTNSLSRTNLLIFEKEKNKTEPFIIIEDDIKIEDFIIDDERWILNVPPDAVAVYLGVSLWVYPYEYHTLGCGKHIRFITKNDAISHDDRLVRIKGMTSAHAVLYMDRKFLQTLSFCIQSYLKLFTAHDLVLATLQKYFPIYALKTPLFYQDVAEGGQQLMTRLVWKHDEFFLLV